MSIQTFQTLLIANRGEIAMRVLRTARRMGLRVVAVYSDADTGAMHARAADNAVRIGGALPRESYLDIAAIIGAAKQSGAQAVHPGYGFLAENADFAQAVIDAGLIWVGPPPRAMRAMGDKAAAKRLMIAAGVPCVPGYDGAAQDAATLRKQAEATGFPLMIKATAGGGGRGMRLVASLAEFDAALARAQSEAQAAFGVPTVLLERAVIEPRHVEIQVFADAHGNVVHLGERDCSVQRRHQKIIEEAPSPAVDTELRRRMGDMAVAAARAIGYRGAGTVECLLDQDGAFYFMEMNTRLQVEHPVTEALTGLDLVEWQLREADGQALPRADQEALLRAFEGGGHAVEVRLCAEDPAHDFLPQSGRLLHWQAAPGARVEHALASGCEVPPYYDSMIAKFIAHGEDRADARRKLADALERTVVLGVRTNQGFLIACLRHPEFAKGGATTGFIARHQAQLVGELPALPGHVAALAAYAARAVAGGHDLCRVRLPLAWAVPLHLEVEGGEVRAGVQALGGAAYQVSMDAGSERLELGQGTAGQWVVNDGGGARHTLYYAQADGLLYVSLAGRQSVIRDLSLAPAQAAGGAAQQQIRAPMAGRIVSLAATVGAQVEKGTLLLALEAMKMEHPSLAPMAATVKAVHVQVGAQVAAGMLLLELEPAA
jgi:geranyl-CoA carboxylase alpha subunit